MPRVIVSTGARLHFGPLAVGATAGRQFGGLGAMVDLPPLTLELTTTAGPHDHVVPQGQPGEARLLTLLAQIRERWGTTEPAPVACRLLSGIPEHRGLGSGTQLALALVAGLSHLAGASTGDRAAIAQRSGRGQRSAIGLHGFFSGGLLVDAGKTESETPGDCVVRQAVPTEWRWLLLTPRALVGLSGAAELGAFAQLGSMPRSLTAELCRVVLMELLPGFATSNFAAASAALGQYGSLVGDFFSPVQGGRYAHPELDALTTALVSKGCTGCGQSSWGPTVYALCNSVEKAQDLARHFASPNIEVSVAAPRNRGATIEYASGDDESNSRLDGCDGESADCADQRESH